MPTLQSLLPTLLGVGALTLVAVAVLFAMRVPQWWAPFTAILRAAVQLAILSVILTGIISDPVWIAVALSAMFLTAVVVATRRGGWSLPGLASTGAAMAAGVAVAVATTFATGAVELTPRYALAVTSIVIGNAMTVATLSGRVFATARIDHWGEVEGWLALGASPRRSTRALARGAVRDALIPSVDQTKTTGLVVLPGAFVGAIFGGLSPLDAARFQLVVLAAILAAGAITATLTVWMHGRSPQRPFAPR